MSLPSVVYLLCFLSALACSILLLRAYLGSRSRLLLWVGLGFSALTLNNLLLVLNLVVWRGADLWAARQAAAALAVGILLYGFLWEAE